MIITVKRGKTSQCNTVTPQSGEPVWDTDIKQLRVGDGATAGGNKVAMEGLGISSTFLVNAFICPAPGTDWTPQLEGVGLAESKTSKKCWLPLNFLKIGDIITSYNLVGDVVKGGGDTVTLDCKLVQVNKADPLTMTDIISGAIIQVTADGNFDSNANCDDTTVATDKQYVLEINGTTSNVSTTEQIIVTGAEVVITRLN